MSRFVFVLLFYCFTLVGTTDLIEVSPGETIQSKHVNQYIEALAKDILPRHTDGKVLSDAGSLGTANYRWGRAYVSTGGYRAGSTVLHYSYNGTVKCQEGWIPAYQQGLGTSTITKTFYDSYHGKGHWDKFIKTSPLENRYLFNDVTYNQMLVGTNKTTEDGKDSFSQVGTGVHGNVILTHKHTYQHVHQIHVAATSKVAPQFFDHNGAAKSVYVQSRTGYGWFPLEKYLPQDMYTSTARNFDATENDDTANSRSIDTGDDWLVFPNIPESIQFEVCVRIID